VTLVVLTFLALLVIGVPIAHVVLIAAAFGVWATGNNGLILVQQTIYGLDSYILLAIPFFVISGTIASRGVTAQRIIDVINTCFGSCRGGLGIATVFACAVFASVSGSAIACVIAIGALMYPKLIEHGYPKSLALGIIASAGTLGAMIPPSIPMLQVAVAMHTSVGAQFVAGFFPGLLIAASMALYVYLAARRYGIAAMPRSTWAQRHRAIRQGGWAMSYPVVILGGIYSGVMTPTETAVVSVFYIILIEACFYHSLTLAKIMSISADAAVNATTLTITVATAQVFIWYMSSEQVPQAVYESLAGVIGSQWTLWAALCTLFFFLGMFTNVATAVLILGPILLPVLGHFQIDPLQLGVVAVLFAEIGFITPPFGLCLFVTMKVTGSSMVEVSRACIPFVMVMLIDTVALILLPKISTWLPGLL